MWLLQENLATVASTWQCRKLDEMLTAKIKRLKCQIHKYFDIQSTEEKWTNTHPDIFIALPTINTHTHTQKTCVCLMLCFLLRSKFSMKIAWIADFYTHEMRFTCRTTGVKLSCCFCYCFVVVAVVIVACTLVIFMAAPAALGSHI